MRRLIRAVLWLGVVAAMLWLARSALKAFVDGPEVTPASGGWPDRAGARRTGPATQSASGAPRTGPVTQPASGAKPASAKASATSTDAGSDPGATDDAAHDSETAGDGKSPAKPRKAAGAKKATRPSKRPPKRAAQSSNADGPPAWVVPNGTAEVLQTHPVKAKLSSRVYRVPGMPMYDRTVADRCYPSVEAAEADGFTRAAR